MRCLLVLAAAAAIAGCGAAAQEPAAPRATIYRDAWGVPHVLSDTDAGAVYGMAWALAEDDWRLIEENYIRALGRAAELEGERAVPDDWMARALEISRLSILEYEQADARLRGLLDAFAGGLNDWLAAHPRADRRLLDRIEPWYPLALIRFKYYQSEFLGYAGLRSEWWRRLVDEGWPAAAPVPSSSTVRDHSSGSPRYAEAVHDAFGDRPLGSNQWAVAPARTAAGHALLLINPHQRFVGVQRYAEIHLHSDEGLVFSGLTVFGFLLPYMGHNEQLGWAYTDNYADTGDLYGLTFDDPAEPLAYRYAGGRRIAEEWTDTIRVRADTGLEPRVYRFWKTHHGPIVGVAGDGRPVAARLARYEEGGWFDQWDAMIRARTLDEWRAAVAMLRVAYMNTMYADRAGNIGYIYNSAVPRRSSGYNYRGVVDGSDPELEWQGFHSLDELPQVFNPPSGWLLNANSTPFTATTALPYARADFPAYMIGPETDNPRAVSSRRVLERLDRTTFDAFADAIWDTRLSTADTVIAVLGRESAALRAMPAGARPPGLEDGSRVQQLAQVLGRLNTWDRRADTASVETTWFVLGAERAASLRDGRPLPALRGLTEALALLEQRWSSIDVPWGRLNRLQRPLPGSDGALDPDRPSLPVAGASGAYGSVFVFNSVPFGDAGPRIGVHGNSFVKVIEFGPTVRARSILNFGQSGDPDSPHFFDQAALYARRSFKPAWFDPAEVRANAVRSYVVPTR